MHEFSFACAWWLYCSVWPCKALGQKERTQYCTFSWCNPPFLRDSAYCSMQGRQRLKIENLIKNHWSCAIDWMQTLYFFDSVVLEGNHSTNCQSAGSQIDPISFILQRTIWRGGGGGGGLLILCSRWGSSSGSRLIFFFSNTWNLW